MTVTTVPRTLQRSHHYTHTNASLLLEVNSLDLKDNVTSVDFFPPLIWCRVMTSVGFYFESVDRKRRVAAPMIAWAARAVTAAPAAAAAAARGWAGVSQQRVCEGGIRSSTALWPSCRSSLSGKKPQKTYAHTHTPDLSTHQDRELCLDFSIHWKYSLFCILLWLYSPCHQIDWKQCLERRLR